MKITSIQIAPYLLTMGLFLVGGGRYTYGDTDRAREIIDRVQEKYKNLKSLQAEFQQTYTWELAGETQSVEGTIYLTAANQYRIETGEQLVITDGKTVWSYTPSDNHVIIDLLKNTQDNQLPKDLFLQYAREFVPDFKGEEQIEGAKTFLLELKPKDDESLITSMKVWIDSKTWFTRKIEQVDLNDNRNTYLVRNIQENPQLDPQLFQFALPRDAEIVDLRGDSQ